MSRATIKTILKTALLLIFVSDLAAQTLPAFPGAEGFGSTTPGGRGGRIIRVTNLNDSGAGSFRAALDEIPAYPDEPRIIVFDVCGTINGKYSSTLNIKYPFCTIAGQTAPGDGICLKGAEISVATHDVVIRGLRVRPGDEGIPTGNNYDGPDGIKISNNLGLGDIYNVIIDHCSVSWTTDENGSVWESTNKKGKIHDVTFQWNVISEALHCAGIHIENGEVQCHSMGMLIGDRVQNVSVHHNLLAHNSSRSALIQSGTKTEFINNVIYNWKDQSTSVSNSNGVILPSLADLIGNYYKAGPNYKHHTNPNPSMNSFWEINIGSTLHSDSRVFIAGNIGPNRSDNTKGEWSLVKGDSSRFKSNVKVAASATIPIVTESADSALKNVLKNAGATAPKRDATDIRVVSSVNNRTGKVPDRVSDVGGYPVYTSSCVVPTDTDGDGLPDYFEDVNGLNKQVKDGNSTELSLKFTGREGYTNIEVYLNDLMDKTLNTETYSSARFRMNDNSFLIYPVPARKELVIEGVEEINKVEIFDLAGNKRFISNNDGTKRTSINTSNLTDGIYVVSICSENNITNQKINICQQ